MTQQKTVDYLKEKGYEVTDDTVWPVLTHPETGKRIQVAFDGSQHCRGWRGEPLTYDQKLKMIDFYVLGASGKEILECDEAFACVPPSDVWDTLEEFAEILRAHYEH